MIEKSGEETCFYRLTHTSQEDSERVEPLPSTAGPWSPSAQHGGPPAALLGRAVEHQAAASFGAVSVGRFTMELLGPVPVGPLAVSSSVLRPGRTVQLLGAELYDVTRERPVASVRAWTFAQAADGPQGPSPLGHAPSDGEVHPRPDGWHGGYLDAVEWRWIEGSLTDPGRGVAWMRAPRLVEGEETSPLQRLLACIDSASGVSAALDVREWAFLNTDLSVHVLRPPEGEWICLDAETTLGPGSVGVATSAAYDERGLVARSAQALLVARRG